MPHEGRILPERILIVWYTPCGLGGVETFTLHFAREAISRGHEVWVAATYDATGPLQARIEASGVKLVDWSGFHQAFMDRVPQAAIRQKLQQDIVEIRPTLVILNDCNEFSIGAAPLMRRVRKFATVVDIFHLDAPDALYLEMRRHFASVVDGVAGTNRNILAKFSQSRPALKATPSAYIPNGVPPCSAAHALPGDCLSMLYVGRLADDQKRVLLIPPLLARLRDRGRAFRATICGEGPQSDRFRADIEAFGLAGQVRMAGYCSPAEVQELLLAHDLFLNVSMYEGFSMSMLEALMAGCVPTCTDVSSMDHSLLVHGQNCMLVPVESPEALVDKWLALTPERIEQMSLRAREIAQSLTSGICYERYAGFVEQLRACRPLAHWASGFRLEMRWDLSRNNPWLPNRSGWRGVLRSLRGMLPGP